MRGLPVTGGEPAAAATAAIEAAAATSAGRSTPTEVAGLLRARGATQYWRLQMAAIGGRLGQVGATAAGRQLLRQRARWAAEGGLQHEVGGAQQPVWGTAELHMVLAAARCAQLEQVVQAGERALAVAEQSCTAAKEGSWGGCQPWRGAAPPSMPRTPPRKVVRCVGGRGWNGEGASFENGAALISVWRDPSVESTCPAYITCTCYCRGSMRPLPAAASGCSGGDDDGRAALRNNSSVQSHRSPPPTRQETRRGGAVKASMLLLLRWSLDSSSHDGPATAFVRVRFFFCYGSATR